MRPPPPPLPGVHHHDEELVGDWLNEIGQSALAADPSPAAGEAVDQQYVQVQVPVSELDEALQVLTIEEVLATVGLDDTTWPQLPAPAPVPVLPRASSSGSNSTDEPGLGSGRRVGAKVRAHPWLSPHP